VVREQCLCLEHVIEPERVAGGAALPQREHVRAFFKLTGHRKGPADEHHHRIAARREPAMRAGDLDRSFGIAGEHEARCERRSSVARACERERRARARCEASNRCREPETAWRRGSPPIEQRARARPVAEVPPQHLVLDELLA
jgi:hypothetical protein